MHVSLTVMALNCPTISHSKAFVGFRKVRKIWDFEVASKSLNSVKYQARAVWEVKFTTNC